MSHSIHFEIDDTFADLVDSATLLQAAALALTACGEEHALLSLVITDDETVQELNRTYRGIDKPTDVLSFANQDPAPIPDPRAIALADNGENAYDDQWDDCEAEESEEGDAASAADEAQLPDELATELADYLGDIIIAYPYATRQAAAYQNSVTAELRLLTVHGVLHLLGYDHGSEEEEAAMWTLQRQILAHFGDEQLTNRIYQADAFHG